MCKQLTPENRIPRTGKVIMNDLKEVINEIQNLETLCPDYAGNLDSCIERRKGIAVDVASVCTAEQGDDQFMAMIKDAGIDISEDFCESL